MEAREHHRAFALTSRQGDMYSTILQCLFHRNDIHDQMVTTNSGKILEPTPFYPHHLNQRRGQAPVA